MFGSKSPSGSANKVRKSAVARDSAVTILTSGCHFVGKLSCRGSSRIGGRIEGEIVSEGLLIVDEEVIVQGRISGRLEAKGRIELHPSSHFKGDISTPILIISEGAQFNGSCVMTQPVAAEVAGKGKGSKVVNMRQQSGPDATPGRGGKQEGRDVAVMRDGDLEPSFT